MYMYIYSLNLHSTDSIVILQNGINHTKSIIEHVEQLETDHSTLCLCLSDASKYQFAEEFMDLKRKSERLLNTLQSENDKYQHLEIVLQCQEECQQQYEAIRKEVDEVDLSVISDGGSSLTKKLDVCFSSQPLFFPKKIFFISDVFFYLSESLNIFLKYIQFRLRYY